MQCISYLAPCVCSSSTARLLVEGWQRDFFLFYIFHSTPTTWQLTRLRCHSLKDWLQVEEGLFSSSVENDGVGFASSWSKSASVPTEVQTWLQLANRDAQNNLVIPNCCYNIILSSLLYTLQKGRKIAPFGFALGGDHQKHCTLGKRLQMVCAVQYGVMGPVPDGEIAAHDEETKSNSDQIWSWTDRRDDQDRNCGCFRQSIGVCAILNRLHGSSKKVVKWKLSDIKI